MKIIFYILCLITAITMILEIPLQLTLGVSPVSIRLGKYTELIYDKYIMQ